MSTAHGVQTPGAERPGGRKWHLIWQDTDNDDAFSVAGEFDDKARATSGQLLCQAEQGFGDVSGSYAARVPVALQSQAGSNIVYLEYAESASDFQYAEEC